MARRRRGRKRSTLARASGPPVNPEHACWIVSSVGQARNKQQEYRRFKNDGTEGQREFDEVCKWAICRLATQDARRFRVVVETCSSVEGVNATCLPLDFTPHVFVFV